MVGAGAVIAMVDAGTCADLPDATVGAGAEIAIVAGGTCADLPDETCGAGAKRAIADAGTFMETPAPPAVYSSPKRSVRPCMGLPGPVFTICGAYAWTAIVVAGTLIKIAEGAKRAAMPGCLVRSISVPDQRRAVGEGVVGGERNVPFPG